MWFWNTFWNVCQVLSSPWMISVDHIRLNASCVKMPHVSYGNIFHLFFAFIVLHIAAPAERDVDARCRGHNSPSGPDCYSEILSCKSQAAAGPRTLSTLLASIVASLQLNTLTWCTTVNCIGVPWLTLLGLGLATFLPSELWKNLRVEYH